MNYFCNCKDGFTTHQERSVHMATCPVITLPKENAELKEKLARTERALEKCKQQRVFALEHTDLTDDEVDHDIALWDAELDAILKPPPQ